MPQQTNDEDLFTAALIMPAMERGSHKGVMHRDIKPSNVLVTMHDGLPLVKVIDFGIAKATQGPLSEQTLHTALEQFIGTPAYISPEQTEITQRNVDTRSDIYSLGVLLYELLTARISGAQGQLEEAEDLARQALVVNHNVAGDQTWSGAYYRTTLGVMLSRRGKYAEAERELRHALAVFAVTTASDSPYSASAEYFLGEVLLATGRLAAAESVLTASLNRWRRGSLPSWRAARSASALGEALYRQGKAMEGGRHMSESLRALASDPKAEINATNVARARVARYLKDQPSRREGEGGVQLASEGLP